MQCFFVSDLHGRENRYLSLFRQIEQHRPKIVFMGGDLLPALAKIGGRRVSTGGAFIGNFLLPHFRQLQASLGAAYPKVVLIPGNDDRAAEINDLQAWEAEGLWTYLVQRKIPIGGFDIYGYPFVPPTPFLLKDWEKFDVSRYVDPGCIEPYEGIRTAEPGFHTEYSSIREDLEWLVESESLDKSVFLFHSPPYQTYLDRAALDGKMFDHVPLDVHVGSIAIRRFIESRQPFLTLHGHIHESSTLTGHWKDQIGQTIMMNAAFEGPGLSLIRFSLSDPANAVREIHQGQEPVEELKP